MASPAPASPRPVLHAGLAAFGIGALLLAVFAVLVAWLRSDLRAEILRRIIDRDASVLYPVALHQLAESESNAGGNSVAPLTALLKSARQRGMLAIAVFDAEGDVIEAVPATQIFVELPLEDYWQLRSGAPISRYHAAFPLDQHFPSVAPEQRVAPVLEVLLALPGGSAGPPQGFVRYYMDARALSQELAMIDGRINRLTAIILLVGAAVIGGVMALAALRVQRAQRVVAERNERLARANLELTLAAKASAIGQIASHLIHGMQGSVAGLREIVRARDADPASPAWETAAGYTDRLQAMIQETVALLADATAAVSYELTGHELAASIRDRNLTGAAQKGVRLEVDAGFPGLVDSHRGSLLCLIATNLVQNAVTATPPGRTVRVRLASGPGTIRLTVEDEGAGIPEAVRAQLFQPGRSTRPGGSGLGLAISRLLALQLGAMLELVRTGPGGTEFAVTMPWPGAH